VQLQVCKSAGLQVLHRNSRRAKPASRTKTSFPPSPPPSTPLPSPCPRSPSTRLEDSKPVPCPPPVLPPTSALSPPSNPTHLGIPYSSSARHLRGLAAPELISGPRELWTSRSSKPCCPCCSSSWSPAHLNASHVLPYSPASPSIIVYNTQVLGQDWAWQRPEMSSRLCI
jgi:hypothetical protein